MTPNLNDLWLEDVEAHELEFLEAFLQARKTARKIPAPSMSVEDVIRWGRNSQALWTLAYRLGTQYDEYLK